eukprot:896600-Prymnesium_polylepis.1
MGWTWGGRAVRDALAGQKRQHDAGGWGGAGRTVGDRHPACGARGGRPRFPPFARLCAPHEKKTVKLF